MQMEDHDDHDGRKVWLNEDEAEHFLESADDTEQRIAFGLGLRCGLRCKELVETAPRDVTEGPAGTFLRVEHGKGTSTSRRHSPAASPRPSARSRTCVTPTTAPRSST